MAQVVPREPAGPALTFQDSDRRARYRLTMAGAYLLAEVSVVQRGRRSELSKALPAAHIAVPLQAWGRSHGVDQDSLRLTTVAYFKTGQCGDRPVRSDRRLSGRQKPASAIGLNAERKIDYRREWLRS